MKYRVIVVILGIVLSGCASIESQRADEPQFTDDPQLAEQIRLSTVEAQYVLEHEIPLCSPYVESFPAERIVPDDRPVFLLDPTTAWAITFRRGGGPPGYTTIRLNVQGTVQIVYYDDAHAWQYVGKKGMLTLSVEEMRAFIEYLNASPLLEMPKAYQAAIFDGTQWAVQIQQGVQRKTLVFHNHFPEAIIDFANTVDRLLVMNGFFEIAWETIPWDEAERYAKTLWE